MRKYWSALALGVGLLCAAPASADFKLSASVDRNALDLGQSLELLVKSEGDALPAGAPDASLLEKDFRILSQGLASRQMYHNGARRAQRSWRYTLEPKRSGALQIPALKVDGESAAALRITVRDPAAAQPRQTAAPAKAKKPKRVAAADAGKPKPAPKPKAKPKAPPKKKLPDVFMEGIVDRKTVPVQAQVLHTVQVFTAINISGRVTEPSFNKSVPVKKISERNYQKTRDGRRYTIYEWKYAIFPQKSGVLKIPAARLDARRSGSRQRIRVSNKPTQVKVLPIPAKIPGGVWLPAEKFSLREEWSQAADQDLEVGQPITRKIKMDARYLLGEQLPAPQFGETPEMKIYPEKPRFKSKKDKNGMIGSREDTLVLIPTRPGKIELPEIRIPWWDMKKQRLQTAVIPARKLNIVPALSAVLQTGEDGVSSIITAAGEIDNFAEDALSATEEGGDALSPPPLIWLAPTALLGALWSLSTLLWWRERRHRIQEREQRWAQYQEALRSERKALERAEDACRRREPEPLRAALLEWGRKRWSDDPPHTLRELCARTHNQELAQALEELNRSLYLQEAHDWENGRLLAALSALRQKPIMARAQRALRFPWREAALPPLYKTS